MRSTISFDYYDFFEHGSVIFGRYIIGICLVNVQLGVGRQIKECSVGDGTDCGRNVDLRYVVRDTKGDRLVDGSDAAADMLGVPAVAFVDLFPLIADMGQSVGQNDDIIGTATHPTPVHFRDLVTVPLGDFV